LAAGFSRVSTSDLNIFKPLSSNITMVDLGRGLRNVIAKITGAPYVDERIVKEVVKELQRVLISADVNVRLVKELSQRIEEKSLDTKQLRGLTVREHMTKVVYDELAKLLGEKHEPKLGKQKILLCGLFGSGKTTTAAKIAYFYKKKGMSTALIACDVDRPAAYEQLEQLAQSINVPLYGIKGEKNVKKIIEYAISKAKEDVLILDSAGRNAFNDELIRELRLINELFKPAEKILVVSADIGQVAGKQADEFNHAVGLTGVIVTKIDGSAKGGGALSAVAASGTTVYFIGHGEKVDDLETFDSKRYVGRLLGFPDLEALIEKVKEVSAEAEMKPEEMMEEKLTLKVFYQQLKAAKKMGPMNKVLSMMGMNDLPKDMVEQSEDKMKRFEAIINSMTEAEKEDYLLIKKSRERQERIAKGSGTKVEDLRELLSQFEKAKKMMDAIKKNRGFRGKLEKMMKKGGMPLGDMPI